MRCRSCTRVAWEPCRTSASVRGSNEKKTRRRQRQQRRQGSGLNRDARGCGRDLGHSGLGDAAGEGEGEGGRVGV